MKKEHAFSCLDDLIVVLIAGILAAIAGAIFSSAVTSAK
jgi:Tfp pilus assembly major pilin PilA